MQDLNPLFIVKLGGIPQPILAAMALMAEAHHRQAVESGEPSPGECVDIEHMVRRIPTVLMVLLKSKRGSSTLADCRNAPDVGRMSTTTATTPKFQHVTIIFPPGEEKLLRNFYVEVMGFREKAVPKVVKPLGWIWFYTGEEGVELHCVPDARSVPADWSPHFCIEVNDLDDYRTRLKAGSFQIIEARALPFRPRFFTRDPFNNLIEIVHVEGDYIAAGE